MASHLEAAKLIESSRHYQFMKASPTEQSGLNMFTLWHVLEELSLHLCLHAEAILEHNYQAMRARWSYAGRTLIPQIKSSHGHTRRKKGKQNK